MADTFRFDLVSPERVLVSDDVAEVIVPSVEGDFGMLPNHAPVIATLRPGALSVRGGDGGERKFFVRGGLAEGGPEQLTVLAQRAMPLDAFGPEQIAEEIRMARQDVEDAHDEETRFQAVDNLERLETLAEFLNQTR